MNSYVEAILLVQRSEVNSTGQQLLIKERATYVR